jgi:hypothetical protein
MSQSWSLYAPVTVAVAERAVADMYKALAAVVGPDLAEHLEPGEELEPPELGLWPEVSVAEKALIPSVSGRGAAKKAPAVAADEAAAARLATCTASIDIEHPNDFDPALVTALRALIASLGSSVFSGGDGSELTTSESLLTKLETSLDLAAALRKLAAGESIGDDDEDDDDEDDDDEDEPAPDSARPEMLRMLLGEIAQQPRIRRKVSELLGNAPPLVATVAERLARIGVETDAVSAKALGCTEADVAAARKTLATIFRRAENR